MHQWEAWNNRQENQEADYVGGSNFQLTTIIQLNDAYDTNIELSTDSSQELGSVLVEIHTTSGEEDRKTQKRADVRTPDEREHKGAVVVNKHSEIVRIKTKGNNTLIGAVLQYAASIQILCAKSCQKNEERVRY